MSEFKGTKGEWFLRPTGALNENGKPLYYDITDEQGQTFLSTFRNTSIGINDESQLANAKLIACAPEMLEALNSFVNAIDSEEIIIKENLDNDGFENCGSRLYETFKQLIKKATE